MNDDQAWEKYPKHHKWFNKLWLAEELGYICGPAGVCVPKKDLYIVRPIYNLLGMGVNAKIMHLNPEWETCQVPAGHFWCERFEGDVYSYDFTRTFRGWRQDSCWQGRTGLQLWMFTRWEKCKRKLKLPSLFNYLAFSNVEHINVETVEDNIIEVHLRKSPDPYGDYSVLIPRWENCSKPQDLEEYTYIESYDNADGQIPIARLGFYAK